jgi:arylesterase/paraoxonase
LLAKNKPENLPEINKFSSHSYKLVNKVRNCEDGIIIEEDAFAILSCDSGRDLWNTVMGTFHPKRELIPNGKLWIYRYEDDDDSEKALAPVEFVGYPGALSFHPLGVEYDRDTSTLFVCNHHIEGSRVDVFTLDLSKITPVAKHRRTILHPLIPTPNSLALLSGTEFYVTNDHYIRRRDSPLGALAETYLGIPGGTVTYVNIASEPIEVRTVARAPFANGVAILNASTVAVAATSAAEVRLYTRLDDNSLVQSGAIPVPYMPDNLSTNSDGSLLIAGHPRPPTLDKLVKHRRACIAEDGTVPQECWKSNSPTWVARWTAERGLEDLYVSAKEFGSGATAAKDAKRNVGIITGLYENGILVWRE